MPTCHSPRAARVHSPSDAPARLVLDPRHPPLWHTRHDDDSYNAPAAQLQHPKLRAKWGYRWGLRESSRRGHSEVLRNPASSQRQGRR
eukprot:3072070-Alexandrium_andersonii.AAC.1